MIKLFIKMSFQLRIATGEKAWLKLCTASLSRSISRDNTDSLISTALKAKASWVAGGLFSSLRISIKK